MQRSTIVLLKFYSFFLYYSLQTLGAISFLNFSPRDSIPILKCSYQLGIARFFSDLSSFKILLFTMEVN